MAGQKKSSKASKQSKTAPVEEETVVPPPVVEEPVVTPPVENVVPTVDEVPVEEVSQVDAPVDKFAVVIAKLQSFSTEVKELLVVVKGLQKDYAKAQKQTKKSKKNSTPGTKRNPSGFEKPTHISDQLAEFLGVESGTMMARTGVTRIINEYIKKNDLQNKADRRKIEPDEKLQAILSTPKDFPLSYFNLQSSIKNHFKSANSPIEVTASA